MNRRDRRARAKQGIAADPARVRALLGQAVGRHRAGQIAAAIAGYDAVLALEPSNAAVLQLKGVARHQMGRTKEGIALIRKAIRAQPTVAEFRNNLGMVLLEGGRPVEAVEAFRGAVELNPSQPLVHGNLGNALRQAGETAAAVEACRKAVELAPDAAETQLNLGLALAEQGETEEAERAFRAAIALDPGLPEAQNALGAALTTLNRHGDAEAPLRKAIELRPEYGSARVNLATVLRLQGQPDAALEVLSGGGGIDTEDADYQAILAGVLRDRGDLDGAVAAFRKAVALEPGSARAHSTLGLTLSDLNRPREAMEACRRAVEIDPDLPDARVNLGLCLLAAGKIEEGIACFEAALKTAPNDVEALYNLAIADPDRAGDDLIGRIEARLGDGGLRPAERSQMHFAAATIYERRGKRERAFENYQAGNALRRQARRFDRDRFAAEIDDLIALFTADFFAAREGHGVSSELPVFVVGMPRSGTSLVEQILASHPQVHGAGELPDLARAAGSAARLHGGGTPYPACMPEIDAEASRGLAAPYLEALARDAGAAARIVDKMPSNFLRLGLAAVLFPKARVIDCRRDAMDTCLSCFFQNFRHPLPFTYDLADLGFYFRQYERLMAHWRRVLPIPILDVHYEALTARQEEVSREMVALLGLDWDDACLAFHETERPVLTASFAQVRMPIYTASVGRWRTYERHLGPLMDALKGTGGVETAP